MFDTESTNTESTNTLRFGLSRTAWVAIGLIAVAAVFAVLAWMALRPVVPQPIAQATAAPQAAAGEQAPSSEPTATPPPTPSPVPIDLSKRVEPMMTRPEQGKPTHLSVPSVGVSTDLETLGLLDDGSLATPKDTDLVGWYGGGARPGAVGPAVLAGHVSWNGDPSVFFRLSEVAVGEQITVSQDDGKEVNFRVTRVEQHPKEEFPTLEVYGNTATPQLRLITCGGDFDDSSGHFYDNVIVFAEME
ncbi:class F sortase [Demequina aurantiaca]|uniref:class F sortase n=1 Tax=Demequina aurantiaca TaxID=676200 RepID=UPI003D3594ED